MQTTACHTRCRPLQSQILDHFALCPFGEFVATWFSFLCERTNSQLTERTKKMNSENIKRITNQAIKQLITALNEGRSKTLTQYLAAIGRFHRYSLRNVMLIASQKPSATHVAGFHTWHKLGRFVKKGEKGILILAPIVRRKNESKEQNDTDDSSTAVGFRAAYVFDISQTEGQELPEIGNVNGDPREYRDRLGKFVTEQGIVLEYSQDIAPARGTSAGGKITLLPNQTP